jgi:hypothetical protein
MISSIIKSAMKDSLHRAYMFHFIHFAHLVNEKLPLRTKILRMQMRIICNTVDSDDKTSVRKILLQQTRC